MQELQPPPFTTRWGLVTLQGSGPSPVKYRLRPCWSDPCVGVTMTAPPPPPKKKMTLAKVQGHWPWFHDKGIRSSMICHGFMLLGARAKTTSVTSWQFPSRSWKRLWSNCSKSPSWKVSEMTSVWFPYEFPFKHYQDWLISQFCTGSSLGLIVWWWLRTTN